jgi:hypothetical protein
VGRPAKNVAIGPRSERELDAEGRERGGLGLRLPKAKPGAKCVHRRCEELPAFDGAEFCGEHGQEYVRGLK